MKKHGKRLLAAALCLAVLLGSSRILRAGAHAVDLVDINDESVFLKQSANTCTLYSVLMMFRRGALLNGDPSWDCFTEDNCRSAWWIEGVGIKNSLSGGGMRAVKAVPDGAAEGDPDVSGRKRLFIELLREHPEGLAVWFAHGRSAGHWHAVLLTDYDSETDTFYCADPSPSVPAGRIALSQSVLAEAGYVGQITGKPGNTQEDILAYITAYWYIEDGVRRDAGHQVVRSPQTLTVDGVVRDVEKYNIDDRNYFRLRDLALLLNDTGSRFSVGWDDAAKTVTVTSGAPYEPDGSELIIGEDQSDTASVSRQTIVINGIVRTDLSVFIIGGHNFFQLRELGEALGFDVDYDGETDTAMVRSR